MTAQGEPVCLLVACLMFIIAWVAYSNEANKSCLTVTIECLVILWLEQAIAVLCPCRSASHKGVSLCAVLRARAAAVPLARLVPAQPTRLPVSGILSAMPAAGRHTTPLLLKRPH